MKYLQKLKKLRSNKYFFRILIAVLVLVVLLGAAIYTVIIKPNLEKDKYIYKETALEQGDMIIGITESGTVELATSSVTYDLTIEDDSSDSSSDSDDDDDDDDEDSISYLKIEEVYVTSGMRIAEGDPLFKLTEKSINSVRRFLTSNQTEASVALSEAQTEYDINELPAKNTYDSSMLDAGSANTSYGASISTLQNQVAGYEANIKVYEYEISVREEKLADEDMLEEYRVAKLEYQAAKNILDDTDIHNVDAYTSNYSDYSTAKNTMDSYADNIEQWNDEIKEYQKKIEEANKNIETANASYSKESTDAEHTRDSAILQGQLAGDIYDYSVDSLAEAVTTAETDLAQAEEALQAFEEFVGDDGIIYADGSGLVTEVNCEEDQELTEAVTLVSYAAEDQYTVSINVSEEDIPSLKVGDSVDIIFTAYEDTAYTGTIAEISTTETSQDTVTISYPVKITINGDTTKLYGGMTADVTFITDSIEDVLHVSKKAIVEQDGKSYVYVKDGAGRKLVEVETGFSNSSDIEIKSGLTIDDIVYIQSKVSQSESEQELMDTDTSTEQGSTENSEDQTTMQDGMEMPDGMSMPDGNSEMPQGMNMPDGMSMPGGQN